MGKYSIVLWMLFPKVRVEQMKKQIIVIITTIILSLGTAGQCFAGQWKQDENGWKYQEDNGNYTAGQWKWIDGNGDGVSEAYCFAENGYIYKNGETPDGYQVNEDGAWVENGVIQTQMASRETTASYSNADAFVGKWVRKSYGNTTYGSYGAPDFDAMLDIGKQDDGILIVLGWARRDSSSEWIRDDIFDMIMSPMGDGTYYGKAMSRYREDSYFYVEGDNMVDWHTNKYSTTVYNLYEKMK